MIKLFKKKLVRTLLLGLIATATFLWAAIRFFEVEPEALLQLFLISLAGVLVIIVAAFLLLLCWKLIRRCFQR